MTRETNFNARIIGQACGKPEPVGAPDTANSETNYGFVRAIYYFIVGIEKVIPSLTFMEGQRCVMVFRRV